MSANPIASKNGGKPKTLPALRSEVERLREWVEDLRTSRAADLEKNRGTADTNHAVREALERERDLERERRKVAEEQVRRLRELVRQGAEEREIRIRAEERARSVDLAAAAVERNLNAVLDRREQSIAEKDRAIASLARALGGAERERDMLQRSPPPPRRQTILERWFTSRRRSRNGASGPNAGPPPPPKRAPALHEPASRAASTPVADGESRPR